VDGGTTRRDTVALTLKQANPVQISINPTSVSLPIGGTAQFHATVANATNIAVT